MGLISSPESTHQVPLGGPSLQTHYVSCETYPGTAGLAPCTIAQITSCRESGTQSVVSLGTGFVQQTMASLSAPMGSPAVPSLQTPVMHPNLVNTLKSIIEPAVTDLPQPPPLSLSPHRVSLGDSRDVRTSLPSRSDPTETPHGTPVSNQVQAGTREVLLKRQHDNADQSSQRDRRKKHFGQHVSGKEQMQERGKPRWLMSGSHSICQAKQEAGVSYGVGSLPRFAIKQEQQALETGSQKGGHLKAMEIAATVPVDLIHNRRPFACHYRGCAKTFRNPQTLKMHLKTHDAGEVLIRVENVRPWHGTGKAGQNKKIPSRCPECGSTFVGLYELRRHFGRKHQKGEKPYQCSKCEKKFFVQVDMRDHEKVCGESLVCKCGMRFAFKCNLVNHMRVRPQCQGLLPTGGGGRSPRVGSTSQSHSAQPQAGLQGHQMARSQSMPSVRQVQMASPRGWPQQRHVRSGSMQSLHESYELSSAVHSCDGLSGGDIASSGTACLPGGTYPFAGNLESSQMSDNLEAFGGELSGMQPPSGLCQPMEALQHAAGAAESFGVTAEALGLVPPGSSMMCGTTLCAPTLPQNAGSDQLSYEDTTQLPNLVFQGRSGEHPMAAGSPREAGSGLPMSMMMTPVGPASLPGLGVGSAAMPGGAFSHFTGLPGCENGDVQDSLMDSAMASAAADFGGQQQQAIGGAEAGSMLSAGLPATGSLAVQQDALDYAAAVAAAAASSAVANLPHLELPPNSQVGEGEEVAIGSASLLSPCGSSPELMQAATVHSEPAAALLAAAAAAVARSNNPRLLRTPQGRSSSSGGRLVQSLSSPSALPAGLHNLLLQPDSSIPLLQQQQPQQPGASLFAASSPRLQQQQQQVQVQQAMLLQQQQQQQQNLFFQQQQQQAQSQASPMQQQQQQLSPAALEQSAAGLQHLGCMTPLALGMGAGMDLTSPLNRLGGDSVTPQTGPFGDTPLGLTTPLEKFPLAPMVRADNLPPGGIELAPLPPMKLFQNSGAQVLCSPQHVDPSPASLMQQEQLQLFMSGMSGSPPPPPLPL